MKNRKYIDIVVDNFNIIKEIDLEGNTDKNNQQVYTIPYDLASEFIDLYTLRKQNPFNKNQYILYIDDGKYFVKKIYFLYYGRKDKTIKDISPEQNIEFINNNDVKEAILFDSDIVENILTGNNDPLKYIVNDNNTVIQLEENISNQTNVSQITLLKDIKINFVKKGRDIELRYNRKKNELLIHCVYKTINLSNLSLYFTAKNDRTIVYETIKIPRTTEKTVKLFNIRIPEQFDAYSPFSADYKFLFKEI